MTTFLIVTTHNDKSLSSLKTAAEATFDAVKVLFYDAIGEVGELGSQIEAIYFRDPFNVNEYNESNIKHIIDAVKSRYPDASYVDNVCSFDDVLIEDKWRQYQLLKAFMPDTKLLLSPDELIEGRSIAKERLSSRGRGIAFSQSELIHDRAYILQPLLTITKEYRIFVINGQVVPMAAIRSSKTSVSKVKMISTERLSQDLIEFSQTIFQHISSYDMIGLDVARTEDGEMVLLEINRSPQFARYNEMTDSNLAQVLMKGIR